MSKEICKQLRVYSAKGSVTTEKYEQLITLGTGNLIKCQVQLHFATSQLR